MKYSYSNDDTCFSIDVIDEILEENFDALLDEGSEILQSIEGTILEEKLFAEFDEFMAMNIEENFESESETEESPFEKITFNTDYKIKTSLEEPPLDLELKPLPDHLEYVFLEEPTFLPIIISSQLSQQNKNKLISVLKRHKQAFAWKQQTFRESVQSVEVFMDYFSVFGNSFNNCLNNLDKMLQRCKDANLVLNWEKCHFVVKEGIMFGHKVSGAGLEVDKAKIDIISKLPPLLMSKALETSDESDVDDNFPGEILMEITTKDIPWFADFANYLVCEIIPKGMTYQQKNKFFSELKNYFLEDPYLFKVCSNGMIRRCVSGLETRTILDQCHHGPTGGHYGPNTTAKKVLDSGFYWPTIIKEAHTPVRLCEACQKTRNISKRDEMPLNNVQCFQSGRMDDPNITMEEYIELEAEKARRHSQTFNWETATYGKVKCYEDINYFKDFETDFPAIVYKDALAPDHEISSEPTVSPHRNDGIDFDFKISFDEFDDEDYIVSYDKNPFSYKLTFVNDLKPDSDNDKV
ncbi:reverse transcriptase domain-containing protein [Tanacetum coccineum]